MHLPGGFMNGLKAQEMTGGFLAGSAADHHGELPVLILFPDIRGSMVVDERSALPAAPSASSQRPHGARLAPLRSTHRLRCLSLRGPERLPVFPAPSICPQLFAAAAFKGDAPA